MYIVKLTVIRITSLSIIWGTLTVLAVSGLFLAIYTGICDTQNSVFTKKPPNIYMLY